MFQFATRDILGPRVCVVE